MLERGEEALIEYVKARMNLPDAGEAFLRRLYNLSRSVTQGVVVELGSYLGRSAIALAWDATEPIYSIDDYADHVDWSGKSYGYENLTSYKVNTKAAQVSTVLIRSDVRKAAAEWDKPIGLLVWDVSENGRLLGDWLAWRRHIVTGGAALLRDTFDRRLGSDEVIDYEFNQRTFTVEDMTPGLLTLRRYELGA